MPRRNFGHGRWEPVGVYRCAGGCDVRVEGPDMLCLTCERPSACDRCGGGIDNDHPTTCSACLYEMATGRSFDADVNDGMIWRVRYVPLAIVRAKP